MLTNNDSNTLSPTPISADPERPSTTTEISSSFPSGVHRLNPTPGEEEPLAFLTEKPLGEMSPEELRAKVSEWRQRRMSVQSMRSALVAEAEAEVVSKPKGTSAKQAAALDDYLSSL